MLKQSYMPRKSSFLSFYSFLVKFSEHGKNLQSVTKLNRVNNAIIQVTYFLNSPMFNLIFCCNVILYLEKVASYEKFSKHFPLDRLKSKLPGIF